MDEVAKNPYVCNLMEVGGFEEGADWGNDNQAGMKQWYKLNVVRNFRCTVGHHSKW